MSVLGRRRQGAGGGGVQLARENFLGRSRHVFFCDADQTPQGTQTRESDVHAVSKNSIEEFICLAAVVGHCCCIGYFLCF